MNYVFDEKFSRYGEVVNQSDFTGVVELMKGVQVDKGIKQTESARELECRKSYLTERKYKWDGVWDITIKSIWWSTIKPVSCL